MKKFKRFAPITKVDADKREVWGTLAEEAVDKSNEILDYEKSKPYFQQWNQQFEKLTCGLDEPSLGNVREMHGKSAAGKFTVMSYDDVNKRISVCAKVVDDNAWRKVQEGVYTGFSIGGAYVETWADPLNKNVKRYVADPREGSLVDNPCMYGATFEVVKCDGATELRKFVGTDQLAKLANEVNGLRKFVETALRKEAKTKKVAGHDLPSSAFLIVGDPEDTETWKLPVEFPSEEESKTHVQNAMARFNQTEGHSPEVARKLVAHAKKLGIDTTNFAEEYVKAAFPHALAKRASDQKLNKSMWDVGRLADALCTLAWMEQSLQDEAIYEDDDSPIPGKIRDLLMPLRQILIDLVAEESAELLRIEQEKAETDKTAGGTLQKNAPNNSQTSEKEVAATMATEKLTKRLEAGNPTTITADELKKVAGNLAKAKSSLENLSKLHEKMSTAHEKMGEHIDGMQDCLGKAAGAELEKAASGMKAHVEGLAKNHVTLGEHMDDAAGMIEDMIGDADEINDEGTEGPAKKVALGRLEKRLAKAHQKEVGVLKAQLDDVTNLLTKFINASLGEPAAPAQPQVARTAVTVEKSADGGQMVGALAKPAGTPQTPQVDKSAPVDAYGMPNPAYVDSPEAKGAGFEKFAGKVQPQAGNPFPKEQRRAA